jgi:integrase
MAKRKGRRHPGVTLIKPDEKSRSGWRVRYKNPDKGKILKRTLDPVDAQTKLSRENYCVRLSERLQRRRYELDTGAPAASGVPLDEALERYFRGHPHLRTATTRDYRRVANKLLRWAEASQIHTCDDLNRARLFTFRESLLRESKHALAMNRTIPEEPRSAHTTNKELRATGTILRYLCDLDLFARLSHDDIRRALKRIQAPVERKDFLKPAQLQKLLEAAMRHDQEHEPIAPFVLFTLLTGMRLGEAANLKWSEVDLDALDSSGRKVGEIYVTGESKTAKSRTIGLEVSGTLRQLLVARRIQTGGRGKVWKVDPEAGFRTMQRLVREYGAPRGSGWQKLRVTCGTFLSNSNIFGSATAFHSSRQLGHSITVAERHYVGLIRGLDPEAKTLEQVMQIESQAARIISSVSSGGRASVSRIAPSK